APAMHLPRFRIRTLMVAVTGAGIILGCLQMQRRRASYLDRAHRFADESRGMSNMLATPDCTVWYGTPEEIERYQREARAYEIRLAEYFDELSKKYEYAARYPWLPVAPDPPEPQ